MSVLEWFDFFVAALENFIGFLDGFYIVGSVSFLDFSIVILVMSMLISMFVARGKA